MAHEQLKNSTLPRALSDVIADLADLLQKEIGLARAELAAKLSTKLRGGIWMAATSLLGLIAAFLVIQALVFGIASFGIALHWSFLIVAAALGIAAAIAYAKGRRNVQEELTPTRSIHQIGQDMRTIKERIP